MKITKKKLRQIIREEFARLNEQYVSTDWQVAGREAGATANLAKGNVVIDDGRETAITMPIRNYLTLADEIEQAMGKKTGSGEDDETVLMDQRR